MGLRRFEVLLLAVHADPFGMFTRFERRKQDGHVSWHFAGFVSFYSFFCWPDTKRLRLAYVPLTGRRLLSCTNSDKFGYLHTDNLFFSPRIKAKVTVVSIEPMVGSLCCPADPCLLTAALYHLCYQNVLSRPGISDLTGTLSSCILQRSSCSHVAR